MVRGYAKCFQNFEYLRRLSEALGGRRTAGHLEAPAEDPGSFGGY
jgi:hypothetical protein